MPQTVNIKCNPNQRSTGINSEKILSNLGKATKRGVKKCPSCGYLNGTRGLMCKNRHCHMIFKDCDKRKEQFDAVKLITGTSRQIYSVRVKDKSPDSRGFVQLPYYENEEKNLLSEVALCFVDTCQRLFDDSILKCHENDAGNKSTICVHIESALKSVAVANTLEFKHDLINGLNVGEDVKKKLCLLAKSTEGPVVQKIARNLLAVKCAVTPTNPLGYLHFILGSSKGDSADEVDTFVCGCSENLNQGKHLMDKSELNKCIHYYACVCAFASDNKLSNKYLQFVHAEFESMFPSYEFNIVNILNNQIPGETVQLLETDNILEFTNDNPQNIEYIFEPDVEIMPLIPIKDCPPKKKDRKTKIKQKDNTTNSLYFHQFLTSITERINGSIFYGYPTEPLIFHMPNSFFNLLKERIQIPCEDRRNITRDKPPLGQFVQTIWYIRSKKRLKDIFDTKEVSLMLSKDFYQTNSGGFIEAKEDFLQITKFVSYLKVGEDGAFIIEYLEGLCEISKFGELRLIYDVGHKVVKM